MIGQTRHDQLSVCVCVCGIQVGIMFRVWTSHSPVAFSASTDHGHTRLRSGYSPINIVSSQSPNEWTHLLPMILCACESVIAALCLCVCVRPMKDSLMNCCLLSSPPLSWIFVECRKFGSFICRILNGWIAQLADKTEQTIPVRRTHYVCLCVCERARLFRRTQFGHFQSLRKLRQFRLVDVIVRKSIVRTVVPSVTLTALLWRYACIIPNMKVKHVLKAVNSALPIRILQTRTIDFEAHCDYEPYCKGWFWIEHILLTDLEWAIQAFPYTLLAIAL